MLATYITDNYDKAVFLTAAKMGETVGVSESTVVRFATYLGYKGYPEFQRALEELVRNKLNSVQRMEQPTEESTVEDFRQFYRQTRTRSKRHWKKLITVRLRWPSRQSLRQKIFSPSTSEAVRQFS